MTSLVTIFVPPAMHGTTTFEDQTTLNSNRETKIYQTRVHNGHLVVDVPLAFFLRMINGPQGKLWSDSNPEVNVWLGEGDRRLMYNNAFPGEHRPPPPPAPEKVAVTLKMRAPEGTHSFSHGGVETKVGKDGCVLVADHVAEVLKSHGFHAA
jgi:hypothetical protein